MLLESPVAPDEGEAIRKVKYFYMSCVDVKTIENRMEMPLLNLLDTMFGGWSLIGRETSKWNTIDWVCLVNFTDCFVCFNISFISILNDHHCHQLHKWSISFCVCVNVSAFIYLFVPSHWCKWTLPMWSLVVKGQTNEQNVHIWNIISTLLSVNLCSLSCSLTCSCWDTPIILHLFYFLFIYLLKIDDNEIDRQFSFIQDHYRHLSFYLSLFHFLLIKFTSLIRIAWKDEIMSNRKKRWMNYQIYLPDLIYYMHTKWTLCRLILKIDNSR